MTTINSVTSASTSTSSAASNSMSSLGVNDFITLMTTQLKYQDPTNPQDSTQFIAQLAQFSTVSGVQEMNASISTLVDQLKNSQALNATSLVGHVVLIDADSIDVADGDAVAGVVNTPDNTSNINLIITDASGQVVRQMSVTAAEGTSPFVWDGTDDSGEAVAAGTYNIEAIANVAGKSTSLTTSLAATINSVTIDSSTSSLQLNTDTLGSVQMADVKQVY
jgi:flagellar basal-body rod modification protein FlgD